MEALLIEACKKLKLGSGIVPKAKKIKADTHLDFLLKLLTSEVDERDIKEAVFSPV